MTLLSSQLAKFFVPESGDRFDLLRAILERLNEQHHILAAQREIQK